MKIIKNNIIPFKGYKAINLFGVIFIRNYAKINDIVLNHEAIHTAQMKELLYVPFYLWYLIEWLYYLIYFGWNGIIGTGFNSIQSAAYHSISFEKEAYENENNLEYLKNREMYSFIIPKK